MDVKIPDGHAVDLAAEYAAYEDKVGAAGGIELVLRAVDLDVNIAFDKTVSSLTTSTDVKTLTRTRFEPMHVSTTMSCQRWQKVDLTVGAQTVMDAERYSL